jgi:hypothetical protein
MDLFNPLRAFISSFPAGNPASGYVTIWRTATGWVERLSDGTENKLSPDTIFSLASTSTAPISHKAIAAQLVDQTVLYRGTPPAAINTRSWVNISGQTISVANAIGPNALAASAYCHDQSAGTTPYFTDGYLIESSWVPSGAVGGQYLWLGAAGAARLTPPPIAAGNIIQTIAYVRPDGQAIVKIGVPYLVQN